MSIEFTIDGQKVTGTPGQTILDVAQENGMHIPTLCSHPRLRSAGVCRVCVVDVGRRDRLETACTTPISNDMTVETNNERVNTARQVIVELMLDNLNVDPEEVTKDGENVLLDLAKSLGISHDRERLITKPIENRPADKRNPIIIREIDKCILCGRCVLACNELKKYSVLNYYGRGYTISINSGIEQPLLEAGCASCGECANVCPTGAFKPIAKELIQRTIEEVLKHGVLYPVSGLTRSRREKLGLPPLDEIDTSELDFIIKKTRSTDNADGGEST